MRWIRRISGPVRAVLPRGAFLAGVLCAGSGTAVAQTGATTLGGLTDRADAVVVVRALRNHASDGMRTVRFRVTRTLLGATPPSFSLNEPEARACGRALHGVVPGGAHLAFVRRSEGADPVLVATGARSLPRLTPGLERHVTELVRTKGEGSARVEVLAGVLQADRSNRIAVDAVQDLAVHPDTLRLGPERRGKLRALCEEESTQPMLRYSLAQVLARFDGLADRAVLRRLADDKNGWTRFVGRTALERTSSTAAARGTVVTPPVKAPRFRSIRPRRRR